MLINSEGAPPHPRWALCFLPCDLQSDFTCTFFGRGVNLTFGQCQCWMWCHQLSFFAAYDTITHSWQSIGLSAKTLLNSKVSWGLSGAEYSLSTCPSFSKADHIITLCRVALRLQKEWPLFSSENFNCLTRSIVHYCGKNISCFPPGLTNRFQLINL